MAEFICHGDFAELVPVDVYGKEMAERELPEHPESLKNRHILYRRRFALGAFDRAVLKISADDYYKLYVNGRFVAMGPAASYPHCYNYNEIDVSDYLIEGENVIAVHTYYQGLINRVWVSGDQRQMLWCELYVDGALALESDSSWLCHDNTGYSDVCIVGYDTAYMERYDSGAVEVGFAAPDFDDSAWENAAVRKHIDYTFAGESVPLIDMYDVIPEKIESTDYGYFVDLGYEAVGYLTVSAHGARGDLVKLYYGEELTEDGRVRYEMRCNCSYREEWVLSGGDDVLDNYDYKAFRYAEIHLPKGVSVSDVRMKIRHYPYEKRATYNTENEKLKKIFKLCEDTIKYGTQENFVDCPTREKGQYLGDVSIAARAHAVLTGDTTLIKKAIRDFCNSAFICPGLMAVSVSSLMQEIADYSLQLAATVLWVYKFDGDIDFLRYAEPYMTGVYKYFLGFTREDALVCKQTEKWNMVDWPMNLRDDYDFPIVRPIESDEPHNVLNAFWYGFIVALNGIYKELGMPRLDIEDKIKNAYIGSFYKSEIGLFTDSAESSHTAIHSNVLPLLFGVCDGDDALVSRIVNLVHEKKLTSAGTYMSYFTLAALVKHGYRDLAEELACDDGCWLNMISEGGTTAFEAWGKEQKWNTSLFHPWSVSPLIVFNEEYEVY